MTDRDSARAAKEHLRAELAALDGVAGVGIGRRQGGYVVTVDVAEETDGERVPTSYGGVDVEVRVVGRLTPLGARASDGAARPASRPAPRPAPLPGSRPAEPVPAWALVPREDARPAR